MTIYRFFCTLLIECVIVVFAWGCKGDSVSKDDAEPKAGSTDGAGGTETGGRGGTGGIKDSGTPKDAAMDSSAKDVGSDNGGKMDSGDIDANDTGVTTAVHFDAPAVAPIVREATPGALQPTAALVVPRALKDMFAALSFVGSARAQVGINVTDSIGALFKDTYNKISGGSGQGLINSSLEDLDTRMAEVDARGSSSDCLKAQPQSYRVDVTSVSSSLDITLNLQCISGTLMAFGRGQSNPIYNDDAGTTPSGDGMTYSLWLYLQHHYTADSAFGYYANVQNVGTDDEAVDFLYLENSGEIPRIGAFRVKAKPSTKSFEFVYGATDGNGAAGGNLLCGFKMISNGKYIWAVGKDLQPDESCSDAAPFTRCLSADDLSEQSSTSPCNALKNAFTMEAPTPDALSTAGTLITNTLPVSNAESYTTSF
jgi:hypothetical protein